MSNLKVSCLQLKAHDIEDAETALAQALDAVDAEARHRPDLMVLPECMYPAYYLSPWLEREDLHERLHRALEECKQKAAQWGIWLCVGLVEAADDSLYNSAFLIDREGEVRARARKHLLWHFDSLWFETGAEFPVTDVDNAAGETCKVGMMICADGRVPEISRALALQGARLVLNVTNWVAYGREREQLSNIQSDHMMSCRALENQVYIACANKIGMERHSILYCGRSQIVAPDGNLVAVASAHREETIRSAVDLSEPESSLRLHPIKDRRPHLYGPLVEETGHTRTGQAPDTSLALGLVQIPLDDDHSLERAATYVRLLEGQGAHLILLGEPHKSLWESGRALSALGNALVYEKTLVAFVAGETEGQNHYKTLHLMDKQTLRGKYRKTHLEGHEREQFTVGDSLQTWQVGNLMIGSMLGYEGMLPEVARMHMIAGAQLVLWPRAFDADFLSMAITRAAENRIFVAMADNLTTGTGASAVVDPAGQLISPLLSGEEQAGVALILPKTAENKLVAPGTDVLAGRQPKSYHHLLLAPNQSAV